jgi:DNA mismatch repair protein MutL
VSISLVFFEIYREECRVSASPIKRLDDDLINKIAAGEVVERPASVVKELVENALDAQATQITVTIKDGGRKLIQVSDNGVGIAPQDLPLAIARHATSKISEFADLYRLHTKGFRGEALASIASVSQLTLSSQALGHEPREIVVHGGSVIEEKSCAHPQGTTVAAKFLFYQTPARLKFLRSKETETSHVVDAVTKLALSHPSVEFKVLQEDVTLFEAPVFQDEKKRVTHILGNEFKDSLYPFYGEEAGLKVSGFFGHPQVAKSQRSSAYFFVNSRAVNDKVLWHAVLEAYRDLLMKGKYPILVLNLEVDENTVDVNVHPAKSEIRFHHPQQVHAFVYRCLRTHLQDSPWLKQNLEHFTGETAFAGTPNGQVSENFFQTASALREASTGQIAQSLNTWSERHFQGSESARSSSYFPAKPDVQKQIRFGKTPYAQMQPIGQLLGTYILCQAEDKLILIDQHAAHERVGFEKLLLQFQNQGIPSEATLVPELLELKPSDAAIFSTVLDDLKKFGFDIEPFGGNSFAVKALPVLLKNKINVLKLVHDLIDDIRETGQLGTLLDKLHHVLATMACHAQIRANHYLNLDEMRALLRELDDYQFTDFCPHGRPVSVEVTKEEIERWFRRVL